MLVFNEHGWLDFRFSKVQLEWLTLLKCSSVYFLQSADRKKWRLALENFPTSLEPFGQHVDLGENGCDNSVPRCDILSTSFFFLFHLFYFSFNIRKEIS